jgi:hypothetical protein
MAASAMRHDGSRHGAPYETLPPAEPGAVHAWVGYPPDDEGYEAFVACLLEHASRKLGVRITNGIIDFTNPIEQSPVLQGAVPGGWIDPSLEHVGSASRETVAHEVLQDLPCHVTLRRREFSMITRDAPTSLPADESRSFYSRVVVPLVNLSPRRDHLYSWLDVMFRFCGGKPVAYYSRYMPGPRIHARAERYGTQVLDLSLRTIPRTILERSQRFRFLWLTEKQWDALVARVGKPRGIAPASGDA